MRRVILPMGDELYAELKAVAEREGLPMAVILRRIFRAEAIRLAAEEAMDVLRSAVRAEARIAAAAMERRIMKIQAKATMAASTNAGLSIQCIAAANKRDATETQQIARAKAVEYLKVEEDV